jgi:hypothetical protein
MKSTQIFSPALLICAIILTACNLPTPQSATPVVVTTTSPEGPSASATPTVAAITHTLTPGSPPGGGGEYDSESHSTSSLKYAGNGDVYRLNRFERPFTQNDMVYLPYIDIQTFAMSKDKNWYYASVELYRLGGEVEGLEPVYSIEVDYDLDGRGDYLIFAKPPFTTEWDALPVMVYRDRNHDVGGLRPEVADPSKDAGDGYDTIVFNAGEGDDPDLAWIRIDPANENLIQFAFKKSLIPINSFEWAAWADAGLKDPAQYAYNDRMPEKDAGSPLKNNANYPVKELYAVDSTCYDPFDTSDSYEPLLCPVEATPTRRPGGPGPTPLPSSTPTLAPIP